MAVSKSADFAPTDVELAEAAKALAHPARIAILRVLAVRSCVCGEIVDELPLAQATVSQHLRVLKDAGFVQGEIDGPRVCYCLDYDALKQYRTALTGLFESLQENGSCC